MLTALSHPRNKWHHPPLHPRVAKATLPRVPLLLLKLLTQVNELRLSIWSICCEFSHIGGPLRMFPQPGPQVAHSWLSIVQRALLTSGDLWSQCASSFKFLHQELYSASQHQAPIALNCVCEHLFFMVTASVFSAISAFRRFYKSTLLFKSRRNHLSSKVA